LGGILKVPELIFTIKDPNRLEILGKVLSATKIKVLSEIVSNKNLSIGEIEKKLNINRSFLTDTLQLFQSLNIIRIKREGRKKIPILNTSNIIIDLSK